MSGKSSDMTSHSKLDKKKKLTEEELNAAHDLADFTDHSRAIVQMLRTLFPSKGLLPVCDRCTYMKYRQACVAAEVNRSAMLGYDVPLVITVIMAMETIAQALAVHPEIFDADKMMNYIKTCVADAELTFREGKLDS